MSWKCSTARRMQSDIKQFFQDNEIELVRDMSESDYSKGLCEVGKLYFVLGRGNRSIVSKFEQEGQTKLMHMAHWFTKHRYDPVWNWRKSGLIRNKYRDFLATAVCENPLTGQSDLIIRSYIPIHMVLTLPHRDGEFQGERFYARHLLRFFAEVRRTEYWKKWIYGGEYGLEIKKSSKNGLHIHMHSFLFLHPHKKVNEFRAWLLKKWEKLTGATFCHFETLYKYKKGKNGRYITEPVFLHDEETDTWHMQPKGVERDADGRIVSWNGIKERKKKFYLNQESPIEEYLDGVMECIKYHFKGDDLMDESGEHYDIPLMIDVLENSQYLRFYSRFGGLYKVPELGFGKMDRSASQILEVMDGETVLEDQEEEEVMGSTAGVEENLINPFTLEKAVPESYTRCVVRPEKLFYKKDIRGVYGLMDWDTKDMRELVAFLSLKDIMAAVCKGRLRDVITDMHGMVA